MVSVNKNIRLVRLYCQGIINTLQLTKNVLEVLSDMQADKWWGQMVGMPEKIQEQAMMLVCGQPKLKPQEIKEFIQKIEENYNSTIATDPEFKSYFHNNFSSILIGHVSPDSSLFKFFRKRGKGRPGQKDCWDFVCFNTWYKMQKLIFQNLVNSNGEEAYLEQLITDTLQSLENTESAPEEILSAIYNRISPFREELLDLLDDFTPLMSEQDIHYAERLSYATSKEGLQKLTTENDDAFSVDFQSSRTALSQMYFNVEYQYVLRLNLLFILLNTCFLTEAKKKKIFELLKASPSRTFIQRQYDYFRQDYPEYARGYVFADGIQRNIYSKDIDWDSQIDSTCFHLPWRPKHINALYAFLLKGYIDRGTDVRDFYYFLTGRIMISDRDYKKINWIHKEKQCLALFIGKLIEADATHSKRDIPKMAGLFTHKGKTVTFHSTTEYSAADHLEKFDGLKKVFEEIKETVEKERTGNSLKDK